MEQISPSEGRTWALVFGLLLVTMPAVTLVTAYAVLSVTQSVILQRLSVIQLVELYLVELLAFSVFSYLLYRLARFAWDRHDTSLNNPTVTSREKTQSVETVEKERN